MRYFLFALLFPLSAHATVYHYAGNVGADVIPWATDRGTGYELGTGHFDLMMDSDAHTFTLDGQWMLPSELDVSMSGTLPDPSPFGAGGWQLADDGDFVVPGITFLSSTFTLDGATNALGHPGNAQIDDAPFGVKGGRFMTGNWSGNSMDVLLGGLVTCDVSQGAIPQSSPVPEPATAGLLLLGALVRRRLHPEA